MKSNFVYESRRTGACKPACPSCTDCVYRQHCDRTKTRQHTHMMLSYCVSGCEYTRASWLWEKECFSRSEINTYKPVLQSTRFQEQNTKYEPNKTKLTGHCRLFSFQKSHMRVSRQCFMPPPPHHPFMRGYLKAHAVASEACKPNSSRSNYWYLQT